ncbi:hypothetical protein FR483_n322R [Paramecium bursaria Chlorella virus FR483]|uniref:Uncharacterized protein n322R n=1 Tax=Paramecium bursaria Chlorella virus FR483 TaxID=399781 RepID=A7J726_PBCVF|nr:hypothetical protein FR483_n322R [Paramecium bursaria Chlorella virus FR483]ABT15607.1 hypothetical protein FR483_n322R [Paramecium bursaria Chlorella virus FR483]
MSIAEIYIITEGAIVQERQTLGSNPLLEYVVRCGNLLRHIIKPNLIIIFVLVVFIILLDIIKLFLLVGLGKLLVLLHCILVLLDIILQGILRSKKIT